MIQEFALDPDLIVEWLVKPEHYVHMLDECFGVGTPRILSEYPPHWRDIVRKRWQAALGSIESGAATHDTQSRARSLRLQSEALFEKFMRNNAIMVSHPDLDWKESVPWLTNVLRHPRSTLKIVFAKAASGSPTDILYEQAILASREWNMPPGKYVARAPDTLSTAVKLLLSCSTKLVFVDPYFRPESGHMRSFQAFFRQMAARSIPAPTIEIYADAQKANKRSLAWTVFRDQLRTEIQQHIPMGWRAKVSYLNMLDSGREFHNRYIMTDFGGVVFATGLDAGKSVHGDDLCLMGREQYMKRWTEVTSTPESAVVDAFFLEGQPARPREPTRPLRRPR